MMRCEIILENGDRSVFYLDDRDVWKLKARVQEQNEYERENGMPEHWNMADELRFLAKEALAHASDPGENETPAAGTAGESKE